MQPGRFVIRTSMSLVGSVGTTVPICEMINGVLSRYLVTFPTIPPHTPMRRPSNHYSVSAASMVSTEHKSTGVRISIADISLKPQCHLDDGCHRHGSCTLRRYTRNVDTCNCTSMRNNRNCSTRDLGGLETTATVLRSPYARLLHAEVGTDGYRRPGPK